MQQPGPYAPRSYSHWIAVACTGLDDANQAPQIAAFLAIHRTDHTHWTPSVTVPPANFPYPAGSIAMLGSIRTKPCLLWVTCRQSRGFTGMSAPSSKADVAASATSVAFCKITDGVLAPQRDLLDLS
jgi:hypothetical protein